MSPTSVPSRARVVIIGGGVIGCSVAYHLARLGWTDVVLLEQGRLSSGTTWHAAGIVGQLRTHATLTAMMRESTALYQSLEAETGQSTGWNQCGALWVASDKDRMVQLHRTVDLASAMGVETHFVSSREAAELWPLMRSDDVVGGVWMPNDAKANPTDVTQALAKGARQYGARIHEGVRVLGFDVAEGLVTGVETSDGPIECEVVVNCAGQWAKALAEKVGVVVPLYSAEHFYVVTEQVPGVEIGLPTLRDPDGFVYFKEEVGALLVGGFEPNAKPWVSSEDIPYPFEFQLLNEDWEQFEPIMQNAIHRVPAVDKVGVRKFYDGPESFTPDHNFIMGEAPNLKNFFVAAGFNSSGIAFAGGAGATLARWIVSGEPDVDITAIDIRRFSPFQANRQWLRSRVQEVVGLHFAMAWPNREPESSRKLRLSPVHHLLERAGACFGTRQGWERPNWFGDPGSTPTTEYAWERQNWFEHSAAEHRHTRAAVSVFDQTSFAKFLVRGRDAAEALQLLCSNDVDVEVGKVVYTGILNERGGYEADVTVTRTAWNEYLVVTSSAQAVHDLDVIRGGIPARMRVEVVDITSSFAVFGVMGPRSREMLQKVSTSDLSATAFPFGWSATIDVGGASVRAVRVTFVGELGWELYVPVEMGRYVFEQLMDDDAASSVRHAGYYAIESLRMEKGYRAWGRELTPEVTPVEAGLTFACKLASGIPFRGRQAVEQMREKGPSRRLASLVLDSSEPYPWGHELLLRDGDPVGFATSASFGHTVGSGVVMGYIERSDGGVADARWLAAGHYEVVVGGDTWGATFHAKAPYDPSGAKIRS